MNIYEHYFTDIYTNVYQWVNENDDALSFEKLSSITSGGAEPLSVARHLFHYCCVFFVIPM